MARLNRVTIYGGIVILIIVGLVATVIIYQAYNKPERDPKQDAQDARYQQYLQKESDRWQKVKEDAQNGR